MSLKSERVLNMFPCDVQRDICFMKFVQPSHNHSLMSNLELKTIAKYLTKSQLIIF